MKEILKELKKKLLNKEMALLDLDNKAEEIIGTNESLYDYLSDVLDQKSFGFIYIKEDIYDNDNNFIIEFDILDKDYENKLEEDPEYKFNMLVKIKNIWIN